MDLKKRLKPLLGKDYIHLQSGVNRIHSYKISILTHPDAVRRAAAGVKQNNMIELLNTDCLAYMATLADNAFDLAIVDVPYGIGENGDRNASRSKSLGSKTFGAKNTRKTIVQARDYKAFAGEDLSAPAADYFTELVRVSRNQIVWGANHFISRLPIDSPCWVVWDKVNSGDFADCELAWTSFKTAVRKFTFRWNGMLQGDMKNKETRIHPTQKPVALYRWLLHNYAKPGDRILDTHLGSASSAIAAHQMGFDFVGTELDPDYYAASVKRYNNAILQTKLF